MQNNFYQTLYAEETDSFQDLKSRYKKLILQYHPDKSKNNKITMRAENDVSSSKPEFSEISKAWNVLKNKDERKKYDAKLFVEQSQQYCIYQNVKLVEMQCTESTIKEKQSHQDIYSLDCRCGGQYIFDGTNLKKTYTDDTNIILDCSLCSLVVILEL